MAPPRATSGIRATGAATAPVVTAIRVRGPGRVAVELDGHPWRVVPVEAVLVSGLAIGAPLDRPTARALARELRRLQARGVALRALRSRDHTAASLDRRLEERGTAPDLRRETVEAAQRAGFVDDRRFAFTRAEGLAARGWGNLMIEDDLERHGVPADLVRDAIAALEPEPVRAAVVLDARGTNPKTARYLAGKGFSEATLEPIVADLAHEALG